jgi:hypothetical protein
MTLLTEQQLEDLWNLTERTPPGLGEIWTAVLDREDYEVGEEIDFPARNRAEALERLAQIQAAWYDPDLTVVRVLTPRRGFRTEVTVW